MYFSTLPQAASTLFALIVCSYALWRGGRAERLAGAALLLDWMATPLLQHVSDRRHFEAWVFLADCGVEAIFFTFALRSNRFWPLWAAAFQTLELLMHLAIILDRRVGGRSYFIGMELASYLILAALGAGTWLETPARTGAAAGGRGAD